MAADSRRRFDLIIVVGVVLVTSYWPIDLLFDAAGGERFGFYRILFDISYILFQIAFLGIVWHTLRRRRQLEDSLEAERQAALADKARTETILSSLHDGITIIDRDFRVLYQNASHRLLSRGDWVGEYCYRAFHRNDRVCDDCAAAETFRDGAVQRREKEVPFAETPTYVEIVTSPLLEADGRVAAAIQTARDITQRRRAEQVIFDLNERLRRTAHDLANANQELEAFNYSLTHDLRSPLAQITTAAEILSHNLAAGEFANEHNPFLLRTIGQGGERIDQMIQGMADLFRIGRDGVERSEFCLAPLIDEVVAGLRQGSPQRRVAVDVNTREPVFADPSLVRIALQNLLENAWKYTATTLQARIECGEYREGGERIFYVRDNGVGFNPALAGRLFLPFQRLHDARDFPGDGIGLSTVQRIVQRHGGRIWAVGGEGEGATFFFTLDPRSAT